MEKEGKSFEKEYASFLNQLAKTLEEVSLKLESSYKTKNIEEFNQAKKFILQIQKKVSEVIE